MSTWSQGFLLAFVKESSNTRPFIWLKNMEFLIQDTHVTDLCFKVWIIYPLIVSLLMIVGHQYIGLIMPKHEDSFHFLKVSWSNWQFLLFLGNYHCHESMHLINSQWSDFYSSSASLGRMHACKHTFKHEYMTSFPSSNEVLHPVGWATSRVLSTILCSFFFVVSS